MTVLIDHRCGAQLDRLEDAGNRAISRDSKQGRSSSLQLLPQTGQKTPVCATKLMKQRKGRRRQAADSLRDEYDFSRGVRGKHSARYASITNVVGLEPDVASAFPTTREVNDALRALAQIIRSRTSSRKSTDTSA